jgi:hypothetical protein
VQAKPQIGFIDERRWLEAVIGPFPSKVSGGPPVQFRIHQRHQVIAWLQVSAPPGAEQSRYRIDARRPG